jgi:Mg2+ and Co2+ transporter CorA
MAVVSKLEDENRRLRDQLARTNDARNKNDLPSPTETVSITREELQCIKNLTEENIKFKRILKAKEKELTQKTMDMDAVS